MNPASPIPHLPGAAAPLRARRCVRHTEREAVARCSTCGGFYCRECVVDHAGRLVCASCLTKAARAAEPVKSKRSFAGLRRGVTLVAAVLVLWVIFYAVGSLLLSMPPELHEGTVWKRIGMD
ncbi:rhomboid family protein [Nibricoccus aquaticus]|uniref:rhomboid family protein n=1 Tax=Nibricoccus aquaticus TaxID=2576891 RepID=UPI0010FD9BBB|nr:rhomboid family protein [Nibricoccus aquaticus]